MKLGYFLRGALSSSKFQSCTKYEVQGTVALELERIKLRSVQFLHGAVWAWTSINVWGGRGFGFVPSKINDG